MGKRIGTLRHTILFEVGYLLRLRFPRHLRGTARQSKISRQIELKKFTKRSKVSSLEISLPLHFRRRQIRTLVNSSFSKSVFCILVGEQRSPFFSVSGGVVRSLNVYF